MVFTHKIPSFELHYSASEPGTDVSETRRYKEIHTITSRRSALGLGLLVFTLGLTPTDAKGAGLPPEQKPRLCDDACEKELENVW